jgi:polysaccharide biosynthesis/export protein
MNTKKNLQLLLPALLIFAGIVILLSGCASRKKTILFQNILKDTVIHVQLKPEYHVQNGDILYIKVQSLDENAAAFINGSSMAQNNSQRDLSEQNLYYFGYEVKPNGMICMPYLDSLAVSGMTTTEIASMLTDSLVPYVREAFVSVRLAGFRVCVFGEVQNSGTFLFYHSHVSIFDVLALAKPTEYYNATNVVITRQGPDNTVKIERIDLTSAKILSSQYYYLKPNDQIYFEPLKVKKYGFSTFPYPLLLSTISTILLIYSIFK